MIPCEVREGACGQPPSARGEGEGDLTPPKEGSNCQAHTRSVSPFPTYAGNVAVDWPGVCKHFGWDASKLCGPCCMAFSREKADENCPWGHPAGDPRHTPPKVDGKPFELRDHQKKLVEAKLTVPNVKELREDVARGKPPGKPKQIGDTLVYPQRHFG